MTSKSRFLKAGTALMVFATADGIIALACGAGFALGALGASLTVFLAALGLILTAISSPLLRLSRGVYGASVGAVCAAVMGVASVLIGIILELGTALCGVTCDGVLVYLLLGFAFYGIYKGVSHYV